MRNAEFNDARLVEVYDATCPWSQDDDFFLAIVAEVGRALSVLDLGCGTGRLALGLADAGHAVTGVDPARASLDAARAKSGAERVTWIEGTSSMLPADAFDAAVMTSHVAQFFVADDEWAAVLRDLHRALHAGGRLVFDARDPADRAWDRWPAEWNRTVGLPNGRQVEQSIEVTDVIGDVVTHAIHYRFDTGEELVSTATLRFRPADELRTSLAAAGFAVEHIFGGWQRQPEGAGNGEFLVGARRT